MRIIRSAVAAAILACLTAAPIAADHGYWPAAGVEPALVAAHQPATAGNSTAAAWGEGCTTLAGSAEEVRTLDPYGHVLAADHATAVVVAQHDGVPLEGSYAVTVYRHAKAGQFIWADADGDGTFAGRHEADAGELFLCPAADLPATDTVTDGGRRSQPSEARDTWPAALFLGIVFGAVAFLRSRSRRAT